MTPVELTNYLHRHIPLSAALGVSVHSANASEVVLGAPFGPNINHRCTVFGGSLSALAILAGWSWLRVFTDRGAEESVPTLVIQSQKMEFLAPAAGAFEAVCRAPTSEVRGRFCRSLEKYRRARLNLAVEVTSAGVSVARFEGEFVALDAPAPDFG